MRKYLSKIYKITFRNRLITPVLEFKPANFLYYKKFYNDYLAYKKMPEAEQVSAKDLFPIFDGMTEKTAIDPHYFYQGIWAADKIIKNKTQEHVDVGSQVDLIGFLTTVTKVKFVDIRPLAIDLSNLENIKGDILHLPFINNSVLSLSCLHVAEHIGLGRYVGPLDPMGTKKACFELSRVLAHGGNLYFSLPIGKPRVCFNAHRIHSPQMILDYFHNLKLHEFSATDDKGNLIRNADWHNFENARYSCGLFHFIK